MPRLNRRRPIHELATPYACNRRLTLQALEPSGRRSGDPLPGRWVGARRLMIFEKQLSSLMTAALLCGAFTPLSQGQQAAPAGGAVVGTATVPAASAAAADAALVKSTTPLTEDDLRA